MTLRYVDPTYTAAKKYFLNTSTSDAGGYLDNIAQPFNFAVEGMPPEVVEAFGSVILGTTDLKDEDWAAASLSEHPHHLLGPEDMKSVVMKAIAPMIRHHFPQLKGAEHTAYICPVISEGRVGYWRGYVVAWNKADALTIAEYIARGAPVGDF